MIRAATPLPPAPLHCPIMADAGCGAWWVETADGLRLRVAILARRPRGSVLLLPGRGEMIEKYARIADDLAAANYGVITLDWRGQGLSQRLARDPRLGHVDDFLAYQRDLDALREAARALRLAGPQLLLAHSMGGCIALRALCDGWSDPAAAAFSAPMWGLPMSRLTRLGAGALTRAASLARRAQQPVPGPPETYDLAAMCFETNELTTDRAMFTEMQALVQAHPELVVGAPSLGWLGAALREMQILERLPSPSLAALAAHGTRESIIAPDAIAARIARWPGARLMRIEGAAHELMMESPAPRAEFLAATRALFDRATA